MMSLHDVTAYVNDTVPIECKIENAFRWTSVVLAEEKDSPKLHVVLLSSNVATWFNSVTDTYDVEYDVKKNNDSLTDTVFVRLVLRLVQCIDRNNFKCVLHTKEYGDVYRKSSLKIIGKFEEGLKHETV